MFEASGFTRHAWNRIGQANTVHSGVLVPIASQASTQEPNELFEELERRQETRR
jgi:hypothetical protein